MNNNNNNEEIIEQFTAEAMDAFEYDLGEAQEAIESTIRGALVKLSKELAKRAEQTPKSDVQELREVLVELKETKKKTAGGNAWSQFLKEFKAKLPEGEKVDRAQAEAEYKELTDAQKAALKKRSAASLTPKESKPRTASAYNQTQRYIAEQIKQLGSEAKYTEVIGACWVKGSKMTFEQSKKVVDAYLAQA